MGPDTWYGLPLSRSRGDDVVEGAETTELLAKLSLDEGLVEVEHRLTLDDRPGPHDVVTRQAGRNLTNVGNHNHHMAKSRDGIAAERDDSANRAITSHFA